MLSRTHRFSFKKGAPKRFFSSSSFRIAYNVTSANGFRAAVVVGKKVDKSAVARNKIKRSIVAIIKDLIPMDTNADIVFFTKKEIKPLEQSRLREEIEKALQMIHIIN